ncbi:hypothetical protein H9635_08630 [Solibacillus sp. A46]|uniref:Uncharacterized protein n=2 Tax=Solibacillus faecavium TaxID=2762221 RepID=A0ABR8XXX7_9BACL|nr:hypothetical protein [Solibacillus faecavium]
MMTQYTALVSDEELHEVDFRGFRLTTVREMKKLYPLNEGFPEQPWHSFDDDVEILNTPDEKAMEKLRISKWLNPPYDLEDYSDKAFIYSVEGRWNDLFLESLQKYIKEHITPDQNVDLIRFWAGHAEDYHLLNESTLEIDEIEQSDLALIGKQLYIRVKLV